MGLFKKIFKSKEQKQQQVLLDIKKKKQEMEKLRGEIFKMAGKVDKYVLGDSGLVKEKPKEEPIRTTEEFINKQTKVSEPESIPQPTEAELQRFAQKEAEQQQAREQEIAYEQALRQQEALRQQQLLRDQARQQEILAQQQAQQQAIPPMESDDVPHEHLHQQVNEQLYQDTNEELYQDTNQQLKQEKSQVLVITTSKGEELPIEVPENNIEDVLLQLTKVIEQGLSIRIGNKIVNGKFIVDVTPE